MTEETRSDLAQSAAALIVTVDELRKVVTEVGKRLDTQDERADRIQWVLKLAFFGLGVDMALSVAVLFGFILIGQQATANTATATRLSTLISDVDCTELSVFLGSYDPSTHAAGPSRQAYENAFATFRRIYADPLHCTTALVPPRADLVTTTAPPVPPPR